jgi:hypothetical protein
MPWRRGIGSGQRVASRTEDPGFESRKGVRFLGLYTLQFSCQNFLNELNGKKQLFQDSCDHLGSSVHTGHTYRPTAQNIK